MEPSLLADTLTIVLAGGEGRRLQPLTTHRAKPAIPFGGKYRVIDFPLSNCLHSGLRRVLVLTQYKSHSLFKHLRDGWGIFNPELGEYITTVPPQMRRGNNWYEGTADSLYQNLYLLQRSGAKRVLVLAGDHVYRMDYAPMINFHEHSGAALTVACLDVALDEAHQFGIMALDQNKKIVEFQEKPKDPRPSLENPQVALASMGIYVFSMEHLLHFLENDHDDEKSSHDFGKDIIPKMMQTLPVYGYRFGGSEGRVSQDKYWRDVGTVDSFYQANMDLLKPVPPLNLYQQNWPIRTYNSQCPPARTTPGALGSEGISINSISANGVVISGGSVQESILFHNVFIDEESFVESSLLMDGVRVGKGARLRNCIIDKDVYVPDATEIGFDLKKDAEKFAVSEKGIVVIPKGYRFQ